MGNSLFYDIPKGTGGPYVRKSAIIAILEIHLERDYLRMILQDEKAEKGVKGKILKVSKINVWLRAYTDESNPSTFLNKAGSARAAGYKTTNVHSLKAIGHQNFTKLSILISAWLEESGLSDTVLKQKLVRTQHDGGRDGGAVTRRGSRGYAWIAQPISGENRGIMVDCALLSNAAHSAGTGFAGIPVQYRITLGMGRRSQPGSGFSCRPVGMARSDHLARTQV